MDRAAAPLPRHDGGTLAILLAGGRGTRLHELTRNDCKPAVFFAGRRRIVDFAMANALRSGLQQVIVCTQYQAGSLSRHLQGRWQVGFGGGLMLRHGPAIARPEGYLGTADAVTRNMAEIDAIAPAQVIVLAADHVYEMDYRPMIAAHRASGAAVTVAAHVVGRASASEFGVLATDAAGRITRFVEKPADPPAMPGDSLHALASMGVYVFDWAWLRAALLRDAGDSLSDHDFGNDILPVAVAGGQAMAYRMPGLRGGDPYWRDVGTLDAFRVTQLDFLQADPPCALPETVLPATALPEPAFPAGGPVTPLRRSNPPPAIVDGFLSDTVLMPGASVGRGARLHRAIVAPDTHIPGGMVIGEDVAEDARWFRRTAGGTVLVTADMLDRRAAARPRFRAVMS